MSLQDENNHGSSHLPVLLHSIILIPLFCGTCQVDFSLLSSVSLVCPVGVFQVYFLCYVDSKLQLFLIVSNNFFVVPILNK